MLTGSKEECEAHAQEVIRKHLFTEKAAKTQVLWQMTLVASDWLDVEKTLARETKCPDLCMEVKVGGVKSEGATKPSDEVLQNGVVNSVCLDILSMALDPGKAIIEEAAAAAAARMAVSAGLVGAGAGASWVSCGASLLVGLALDEVLDWFVNPAGDIQKKLDDQVRKTAQKQKSEFHNMMMKELDARRKDWERQLR